MSDTLKKNPRFAKYLKDIGILEPIQKRIETIYELFQKICPTKITDIFVNDYITEDGSRGYGHLRFFSENYILSAMSFMTEDDFRISKLVQKHMYYIKLQRENYDLKRATKKSRIVVTVFFEPGEYNYAIFKASGENCDYLRDITLKYLVPNLD